MHRQGVLSSAGHTGSGIDPVRSRVSRIDRLGRFASLMFTEDLKVSPPIGNFFARILSHGNDYLWQYLLSPLPTLD